MGRWPHVVTAVQTLPSFADLIFENAGCILLSPAEVDDDQGPSRDPVTSSDFLVHLCIRVALEAKLPAFSGGGSTKRLRIPTRRKHLAPESTDCDSLT